MNEDSVTVDAWSVISWGEPDVSSVRTTCKMKPAPAPTPSFSLDVPRASWQGQSPGNAESQMKPWHEVDVQPRLM